MLALTLNRSQAFHAGKPQAKVVRNPFDLFPQDSCMDQTSRRVISIVMIIDTNRDNTHDVHEALSLHSCSGDYAGLHLLRHKNLYPWEVNTERSYYEEQFLRHDSKHAGTDILIADEAPSYESI